MTRLQPTVDKFPSPVARKATGFFVNLRPETKSSDFSNEAGIFFENQYQKT